MKPLLRFEVVRRVSSGSRGAFGSLWHIEPEAEGKSTPIAVTLEPTYDNKTKIPDGLWYCDARKFFKGNYETYEIHIPFHEFILFHKGNWVTDTDGCVLVAEQYHDFDPRPDVHNAGVGNSAAGFSEFMQYASRHTSFFTRFKTVE